MAIGGVEKVWRVRGHAPDEYAKNPAARFTTTTEGTHSRQDARRVRHQGTRARTHAHSASAFLKLTSTHIILSYYSSLIIP